MCYLLVPFNVQTLFDIKFSFFLEIRNCCNYHVCFSFSFWIASFNYIIFWAFVLYIFYIFNNHFYLIFSSLLNLWKFFEFVFYLVDLIFSIFKSLVYCSYYTYKFSYFWKYPCSLQLDSLVVGFTFIFKLSS